MSQTTETDAEIAAAQGYKVEDAPRHSLWKLPGDEVGRTVMVTDADGSGTWNIHIHNDTIAFAVAAFLEQHGAPTFVRPSEQEAYCDEMEKQLRAGLTPVQARDAALQAVRGLVGANLSGQVRPLPPFPPLRRS